MKQSDENGVPSENVSDLDRFKVQKGTIQKPRVRVRRSFAIVRNANKRVFDKEAERAALVVRGAPKDFVSLVDDVAYLAPSDEVELIDDILRSGAASRVLGVEVWADDWQRDSEYEQKEKSKWKELVRGMTNFLRRGKAPMPES